MPPEAGGEKTITLPDGRVMKIQSQPQSVKLPDGKVVQVEMAKLATGANGKAMQINIDPNNLPPQIKIKGVDKPIVKVSAPPVEVPAPVVEVAAPEKSTPPEGVRIITTPNGSDTELREENVQEILTAVPSWMIRWGNTLFCALILMLLLLSWFVPYPEVVSAKATVINAFPSQKIELDQSQAWSQVLVELGEEVAPGEALIILENDADYEHVFLLQSIFDSTALNSKSLYFPFHQLPSLTLGELQVPFAQFEDSYFLYQQHQKSIETAKGKLYQSQDLTNTSSNKIQLYKQLIADYQALETALADWQTKYVISSNLAGKVKSLDLKAAKKSEASELALTVEPFEKPEYIAHLEIPRFNSGKIKPAQTVLLQLDNYPEMEYGVLEAKVLEAPTQTSDNGDTYVIKAELPQQLMTTYHNEIDFNEHLAGRGEVIVDRARLLNRFLNLKR